MSDESRAAAAVEGERLALCLKACEGIPTDRLKDVCENRDPLMRLADLADAADGAFVEDFDDVDELDDDESDDDFDMIDEETA